MNDVCVSGTCIIWNFVLCFLFFLSCIWLNEVMLFCRDIYKHTLISRFSSPGMSVSRCISCGLFRWQKRGERKNEELIVNEIMHATNMSFEGKSENPIYSPDDKDVAIWLLISTVSDPDSQFYRSSQQQSKPTECWRLALLVDDTLIIGSVLDKGYIYY